MINRIGSFFKDLGAGLQKEATRASKAISDFTNLKTYRNDIKSIFSDFKNYIIIGGKQDINEIKGAVKASAKVLGKTEKKVAEFAETHRLKERSGQVVNEMKRTADKVKILFQKMVHSVQHSVQKEIDTRNQIKNMVTEQKDKRGADLSKEAISEEVISEHTLQHSLQKEIDTRNQVNNMVTEQKDKQSAELSKKDISQLVKQGMKQRPGEHEVMIRDGKTILVSTRLDPDVKTKAVAIHVIAKNAFASGSYGEVHGAFTLGTAESVAEKRAKGTDAARADVRKEAQVLRDIHRHGHQRGVQSPPFAVTTDSNAEVIGFIGRRYDGDGWELANMVYEGKNTFNMPARAMIDNLNQGLKSVWKAGYFQGDHKLENTLYMKNGSQIDLVVADLGGTVSLSNLKQIIEAYVNAGQKGQIPLQDILGGFSVNTTCQSDVEKTFSIINNADKGVISTDECFNQLTALMEARMVFSQAVVSYFLLIGDTEMDDKYWRNGTIGGEVQFQSPQQLRAQMEQVGLQDKVSEQQYNLLFRAFSSDYTKRPTLEEFAQGWSQG